MHISWLGNTGIKLVVKPFDQDVTVVIDAYKHAQGAVPRSLTTDIALYTRGLDEAITISGDPFVLSGAGECETKDVLIASTEGHEEGEFVLRIDAERMSIGHLGLIKKQPSAAIIGMLSGVDILFIPVGGKDSISAETAAKIVSAIEPRIVIPMASKSDNDPEAADVNDFVKQLGIASEVSEKKVIIKHSTLPQDEMKIIVLTKE